MNSSHSYFKKKLFDEIHTQEEFKNYIESLEIVIN